MSKLALSSPRQAVIKPILWRYTQETPIEELAEALRSEGLNYEAEWLLKHPGWLRNFWREPTPEQREEQRRALEEEQKQRARLAEEEAIKRKAFLRERAKDTDPDCPCQTIKAATDAGFRPIKADDYGGERWKIKGRIFVRNTRKALSRTAWAKLGREVMPGEQEHGVLSFHCGTTITYGVYRLDQTESAAPLGRITRRTATPLIEVCKERGICIDDCSFGEKVCLEFNTRQDAKGFLALVDDMDTAKKWDYGVEPFGEAEFHVEITMPNKDFYEIVWRL
jgi:hypothetical protein